METTAAPNRALSVTKSYHDAAAIYGKHFLKLVSVAVIPSGIVFLLSLATKVSIVASLAELTSLSDLITPDKLSSLLTVLLVATIALVQAIGVIALIATVIHHEHLSILKAFEESLTYFWRFVAVGISVAAVTIIGLILGFVPVFVVSTVVGLFSLDVLNVTYDWIVLIAPIVSSVFSTFFIFSPFILIAQNTSIRAALRESPRLVRGHFWETAIRLLIFYSAAAIVVLSLEYLPTIGRLVSLITVTPFTIVYLYILYTHLIAPQR